MKAKRGAICSLAALAVLLAAVVVVAQWDTAKATYNPTMATSVSDTGAGANADVTTTVSLPEGDFSSDFSGVLFFVMIVFTPPEWGMGAAAIPLGAHVADLQSDSTLGLLNNVCITALPVAFEMLKATTNTTDTISFDDGFADLDGNTLPDAVDKYPDFLNTMYPSLTPIARSYGQASVAGTPVSMNLVVFEPGTTLHGQAFDASLGYPSVSVFNDPTAELEPGAITDFCTPLGTTTTVFGITKDNSETAADESGFVGRTNPAVGGDYAFTTFSRSQGDADGDGIENPLDTCPFDVNEGDPRVAGDGDNDMDGIDNVCDPTPDEANIDHDGDVYLNRGDNCPLVNNPGNLDSDGDHIGDACDTEGNGPDVPDGEAIEVYLTETVAIRGMGATITVNSTGDSNARDDVLTLREGMLLATGGLAVADLDSGECGQLSNSTYGPPCSTTDSIGELFADAIVFETIVFLPSMPATITPGSVLPELTTGGDTVDGSAAGVIIDGSGASWSDDCFVITSANNTIKGLEIYNWWFGVWIRSGAEGNTIGGTAPGERNVISGNDWGVVIADSGTENNVVKGNYIGTDASGSAAMGNGKGVLIWVGAQNNTIGGTVPGEGNVIAYNIVGVTVQSADTTGNTIRGNSIHSNSIRGIENVFGGNEELAPPVITGIGSVSGAACPFCWVEVFSDEDGQGRMFLLPPVQADWFGNWVVPGYPIGPNVTATATDTDGNTSEFSAPFACGNDSDGDNIGDACDPAPGSPNADADGFDDYVEAYIGTDPLDDCPDVLGTPGLCPGLSCDGHDAWPPDLDIDREADIADVIAGFYGKILVPEKYDRRADFDTDGELDIADVIVGYKDTILTSCTP